MRHEYLREPDWIQAQEGQDLIEYSLLVALISTIGALSLVLLGVSVGDIWQSLSGWLGRSLPPLPPI